MTTTQSISENDVETGNVLRIRGTAVTGSVIETHPDYIEVNWSDGQQSVERFPIIGIDFV